MKVFVVCHGEKCEGGDPVSIHKTRKNAIKAAKAIEYHFDGGWARISPNDWTNGCDFVRITKMNVED